jgi:hypothetical protein
MYCGEPILDRYEERIRYCVMIDQQTFLFCSIALTALDFLCSEGCDDPIAAFISCRMMILQCTHDKRSGIDDILCDFIAINSEIAFSFEPARNAAPLRAPMSLEEDRGIATA